MKSKIKKFIDLVKELIGEEVDEKLKNIMSDIHTSCIKYGKRDDGYIDYVAGANISGFVNVADAMLAQGVV